MVSKILIVDDSAFMRIIIKNILAQNGFNDILEARDGLEGVEVFQMYSPDLVLMDIVMPRMDGIEALGRIMSSDKEADVVMLTAVGQEEMRDECMRLGAMDYIVKPFEEKRVMKVLHRLMGFGDGGR